MDFGPRATFNERRVYEAVFDRPNFIGRRRYYFICCAPRVGSWLLCDLLEGSGDLGVPAEYFNTHIGLKEMARRFDLAIGGKVDLESYINILKAYRTGGNGVFGAKLQYWMMPPLLNNDLLFKKFPDVRFIYMERRDRIAQAVSYDIARHTEQWTNARHDANLSFDQKRIQTSLEFIDREYRAWDTFFKERQIAPLRIDYEDLLADAANVCANICAFVGIKARAPFKLDNARLEKQATAMTADWVKRLRQVSG